ncbi:histidine kinase [Lysinibacter cavernae]|uniref:histidine kinase n=1 Tax=Lysinibacter cavernae TaxID=1640652 RepID=A0A7X5QZJ0_9MICO|nr:histidine kinase [Lysinibacter cavernae]NIH52905.1 signal transduction histidine kinase [Lysinibacter cavernae]
MATDHPSRAERTRTMLGLEPVSRSSAGRRNRAVTRPQLVWDILLALLVGVLAPYLTMVSDFYWTSMVSILVLAVAIALRRLRPGLALALCWLSACVLMLATADAALAHLGMGIVVYSAAAYGTKRDLWVAGASALLGGAVGGIYLALIGSWIYADGIGSFPSANNIIFISVMIAVFLGAAWLLGFAIRLAHTAQLSKVMQREAEAEALRSRRVAALENEKAELARDMHDVIGHSLAVIIAQSDAVRFLPDDDTEGIKRGVFTIGETARRSLGDVRKVLGRIGGMTDAPIAAEGLSQISDLVRGVTAAGASVDFVQLGTSIVIDERVERVVYRVLQELLTNALKHGRRESVIVARLRWEPQRLTLSVDNPVSDSRALRIVSDQDGPAETEHSEDAEVMRATRAPGNGIVGMRYRLAEVGGTLSLTPPSAAEASAFLNGTSNAAIFRATATVSIAPKEHSPA